MKFKQLISIIAGFGTIALLSSIGAGIQGHLYPHSIDILGQPVISKSDIIQLLIKMACIYTSCFAGGMLATFLGGNLKANLIVGILIMLVITWLWLNTVYPIWFWMALMIFIIPFVILGHKILKKQ